MQQKARTLVFQPFARRGEPRRNESYCFASPHIDHDEKPSEYVHPDCNPPVFLFELGLFEIGIANGEGQFILEHA
jgi:hypothetical protein